MARDPVRLRDVAEHAGVTISTASRALRRPEMVRAETRSRVEEAARVLGYTPNRMAQAVVTGRSRTIVFMVLDPTNPIFAILARAAQAEARQRAFDVLVVDSMLDVRREAQLLEQAQHYAEGIIMCIPQGTYPLDPDGPPIVAINRRLRGSHAVLLDQANVIEQQLAHLVALGHRRIAYLDGPDQYWAAVERRRHAERLAGDHPIEIIGPVLPTFPGGYGAVDRIDPAVTAVIAFTDHQAAGVVVRLAELGRRVPAEVSVIGSNDLPLARMYNPPLTTMHTPFDAMGRAAVSLLLDAVDGANGGWITQVMTSELVVRSSTAARR
ncbi:MAG: LacI family DNA-binding transcriptional regulator [Actinomycetota bacterium]